MADLTDIQSAETVKIAGANPSGIETNFANVNSAGALAVENTLPGSTQHFSDSVTSPATTTITCANGFAEVLIRNTTSPGATTLQVSFDGGTNYFDISPGDTLVWSPRGTLTVIYFKSSTGTSTYKVVANCR